MKAAPHPQPTARPSLDAPPALLPCDPPILHPPVKATLPQPALVNLGDPPAPPPCTRPQDDKEKDRMKAAPHPRPTARPSQDAPSALRPRDPLPALYKATRLPSHPAPGRAG